MAGDKATDESPELPGGDILSDTDIDQAVGGLRDVLDQDASGMLNTGDAGEADLDSMGGAAAFGSDFGADFPAGDAADDPFDLGGGDAAQSFGGGLGSDFGSDLGGGLDNDFGAGAAGGGLGDFGGAGVGDFGASQKPEAKTGPSGEATRMDLVLDIPVDVQIILGSSRMAVQSLMNLNEGATIALDRKIGEPVEIMVNGKMIGRGEITVLESDETRFGVRMIEVFGAKPDKGSKG